MPEQTDEMMNDEMDDEMMDQLLRDAGSRLRATAPDNAPGLTDAAVVSMEHGNRHRGPRQRVILGASIAIGLAAAIVLVVVLAGTSHKTLGPSPVVTQPTNTVPQPTNGPTTTESTEDTTSESLPTVPGGQPAGVTVTNANWDGIGGACVTVADGDPAGDVTGCLRGTDAAGPYGSTALIAHLNGKAYEVTGDPDAGWQSFGITTTDPKRCGSDTIDTASQASMALIVRCDDNARLLVSLPSTPDGARQAHVLPAVEQQFLLTAPLDLTELTPEVETDVPAGLRLFSGTLPIAPGQSETMTCLIVVGDAPAWHESCQIGVTDMLRFLVLHRGTLELGEFVGDGSVSLAAVPDGAAVRINGCATPAIDLVATVEADPGLVTAFGCGGSYAIVGTSPVALSVGPVDGAGHLLQLADNGNWTDLGMGTAFPCNAPAGPECEQLGIEDNGDANSASQPMPSLDWFTVDGKELKPEIVTAQIRALLPADGTTLDGLTAAVATSENPGGETTPTITDLPVSFGSLRVVQIRLPDDATTNATIALWTRDFDGKVVVDRAVRFFTCGRGVTEVDGQQVCV